MGYLYEMISQKIGAHVWGTLCYLICLRHLIRSKTVTNQILFLRKDLFSYMRAQHELASSIITMDPLHKKVSWIWSWALVHCTASLTSPTASLTSPHNFTLSKAWIYRQVCPIGRLGAWKRTHTHTQQHILYDQEVMSNFHGIPTKM